MAGRKINHKGRSRSQSFIMLRHDMFDSLAWHSLRPVARCLWLEIIRRYNGRNNGEIPLSCGEAEKRLRVSKNTAGTAFKALIAAGFIVITRDSGFNVKYRTSRRWALTHLPVGNNSPTNEWRQKSKELEKQNTVTPQGLNGHVTGTEQG